MNKRLRQCGAVLAVLAAAPACADNLVLNCDSGKPGLEAKRIKAEAAGVVKRLSKHVLQVTVAGKTHKFTDKPPYDEPLDGVRYEFCQRKEGFILVAHEDGGDFTGKLINEANGNITDAGGTVEFSADRRAYLASSQSNGLDATSLAVHALDGRVSWEGRDYLPHPTKADSMVATLGKIQWEANGELSAQATCLAGKVAPWRVKLVKSGGAWDWQPRRKCPDA
ncbi:hypothetical protein INH39_33015 [Massilia violaceinigra]|uniref:Uncharacterized protein n=1 Tax=Massilia violaceinigra TaxID=2045208 RepID=A0ABY4A5N9_9BURK|nr:hypothetical protein [Massilia violaceinigra]UOD30111.1 hypothetical protein INH39_33015 [Massilia violaceinigra]